MNTNDDEPRNVNSPAYDTVASSPYVQNVGCDRTRPQVRSSTAGCVAWGLRRGTVSTNRQATATSAKAPNTASAPSAARQPQALASQLPTGALSAAITPRPLSALLRMRAPCSGAYRSRTMARPAITAAPIAAPCSTRHRISQSMLPASNAPTPATAYRPSPASSTGRRPMRSDSGPHTICEQPNASSMPVSVSCACDSLAPKPLVMAGRAGK